MNTPPKYEKIKRVGSGAQGEVWKAIRDSPRRTVALKIINVPQEETQMNQLLEELKNIKKMAIPNCHPNVVCYYDYSIDDDILYIETEYIEGEDLHDYTKRLRERNEYEKLYRHLLAITKDLVEGLKYIHSKGVLHNDIKPGNIMVETSTLTPKFVDFGISCSATSVCRLGSGKAPCCGGISGTPTFASPEMYKDEKRYPVSDIWSLGMTLYESATGSYPYNYTSSDPNLREAMQNIVDVDPKELNTSNQLLNTIVNRSLVRDPAERITAQEISDLINNQLWF